MVAALRPPRLVKWIVRPSEASLMSVLLHVGWLDEMRRCDPEGHQNARKQFAAINTALRKAGAPEYEEPEDLLGGNWDFKLYPSNGLAFLQRFAAYCNDGDDDMEWPTPGDPKTMDNPLDDEVVEDVYSLLEMMAFSHLIMHNPAWGYWVPVDFQDVIFPDKKLGIGNQLGSSVRLKAECEELAAVLRLPLDLDPEDETVRQAQFHPGKSRTGWKKYGVESHNLLALHRACQKSITLGAAIYVD
jgi:hypothetical protein